MMLLASIYPFFYVGPIDFVFYYVAGFVWLVRRVLDFFVFFAFNNKFQKISRSYFRFKTSG
jgi:hypothetical protein